MGYPLRLTWGDTDGVRWTQENNLHKWQNLSMRTSRTPCMLTFHWTWNHLETSEPIVRILGTAECSLGGGCWPADLYLGAFLSFGRRIVDIDIEDTVATDAFGSYQSNNEPILGCVGTPISWQLEASPLDIWESSSLSLWVIMVTYFVNFLKYLEHHARNHKWWGNPGVVDKNHIAWDK